MSWAKCMLANASMLLYELIEISDRLFYKVYELHRCPTS